MNLYQISLHTPIGFFKIASNHDTIISIHYTAENLPIKTEPNPIEILRITAHQIKEYFDGTRKSFSIPFVLTGTPVKKKIYNILINVPYGSTISYGELAKKAGINHGGRFVGSIMAQNQIPILIPCHRVIHANGSIGNYSAGGEKVKKWLIDWEAYHP